MAVVRGVSPGWIWRRGNWRARVRLDPQRLIGLFECARIRLYITELLGESADVVNRKTLKPLLKDAILRDAVNAFSEPFPTLAGYCGQHRCDSSFHRRDVTGPRRCHHNADAEQRGNPSLAPTGDGTPRTPWDLSLSGQSGSRPPRKPYNRMACRRIGQRRRCDPSAVPGTEWKAATRRLPPLIAN